MLPWIVCALYFLAAFCIWFVWRKNPRIKWHSGEIVLFVFFVFAQIVDIVQTQFAVNVIGFAYEQNPLYQNGFDIWSASAIKFAYILMFFLFLKPQISKIGKYNVRPKFFAFARYMVLVIENLFSIYVIVSNETQAYLFIAQYLL